MVNLLRKIHEKIHRLIHISDSLIITAILFIGVHVLIWSGAFKSIEAIHDKIHPHHHGNGASIFIIILLFIIFHVIVWGGGYCFISKIVKRLKGAKDMMKRKCPRCGKECYSAAQQEEFWECPHCKYNISKEHQEPAE